MTKTVTQELADFLIPPRKISWSFHIRDWAIPGYLRVAVYGFATYYCIQALCFSVTVRGKGYA